MLSSWHSKGPYQQPGMTPTYQCHSIPYLFSHHLLYTNHFFHLPHLMSLPLSPVMILVSIVQVWSSMVLEEFMVARRRLQSLFLVHDLYLYWSKSCIWTLLLCAMAWCLQATLTVCGLLPWHVSIYSPPMRTFVVLFLHFTTSFVYF